MVKKGRDNNYLRCKLDGIYTDIIRNNIGVFQGIPLSAYIFIIYADHVMGNYKNKNESI